MSESSQHTRHNRKFFVFGGILLALIITGLIALPTIQKRWSAPMGPALELPTYTPTHPQPETPTVPATATKAAQVSKQASSLNASATPITAAPTLAPSASPAPTQAPLCGGPPVMVVLAVGVDTEDDTYTYGLGDAIRIVRVDFVTPKITALSMSRDLWVEIPEISDHYDLTHGKLNQSYLYGTPGMGYYDSPGGGSGLMARTLDLNFGLRADHYGALNMSTFARIVDAVGGIDVYLPTDIDGTPTNNETEDMGYFYSGQNHFTGDEAMRFSRIRKRYNDLTRMDHQNMVLCALRKKILSPQVLPKIPQIIAAFKDSVITDLSLEQMSQLACLLPHIQSENLLFTGLPDEIYTPGTIYSPQMRNDTFIMKADPQVVRDYVQRFLAGEWPNEPEEPTCQ